MAERSARRRSGSGRNAPGLAERVSTTAEEEDENDIRERKFVKMEVKYITDGEGFINGTLLVTPNSFMFDPNVSDALVLERGHEHYAVQVCWTVFVKPVTLLIFY